MDDCPFHQMTVGDVLAWRARTTPDSTFLRFPDLEMSFSDVDCRVDRVAYGLVELGVGRRDHVAVMLPNSPEVVLVMFALARLGAVAVPVNIEHRGRQLRHVLATSDSTTMVVDAEYLDRVRELESELDPLPLLVVRGASEPGNHGFPGAPTPVSLSDLMSCGVSCPPERVRPSDLLAIMYTSGTTGPAKGVEVPHALALSCAVDVLDAVDGWHKRLYCPLPLFHAAGLWDGVFAALCSGTSIAVVDRFSATRFWDDVRMFDAQVALSVFSMLPILLNRPPTERDRDHPLEVFYTGKSALDPAMRERFGVRSVESYTSTEAGVPLTSPFGSWRAGSCGRVNARRFEAAVVDDEDQLLPAGAAGELVLRPRQPHVLTTGYHGMFTPTARAFRNMWFHTGDCVRRDEDGYFYFLDRMGDAIRRRGENISAFDIEAEVNAHPSVLESAAIGVPSEVGEDDVKVVVVLRPGAELDGTDLIEHCQNALPGFMVPRYTEIVASLPRTSTDKVAKHELRAAGKRGITPATWDRDRRTRVGDGARFPDPPKSDDLALEART